MSGSVLRQRFIELQSRFEHDRAAIALDVEQDRGQALRAGVEAEVERHAEEIAMPNVAQGSSPAGAAGRRAAP